MTATQATAEQTVSCPVPESAAVPFEQRRVTFTYSLGEIGLFAADFRLWMWTRHFMQAAARAGPHPAAGLAPFISDDVCEAGKGAGDGLAFPSFPTPSPLPVLAWQEGYLRLVRAQYRRFIVDLTGTFEAYEKAFSAKTRFTLRKKVRKFAELSQGTLEWKVYRTAKEMDEFHVHAREVSARTYQEKLLDAGLPDTADFRARTKQLAEADAARGYVLFHGRRPVAYVFCPISDGAVIYQYVGYDPAYREQSPGTVLQYVLLESLFAEGRFTLFDFTEGEGPHKQLFSTGFVPCADLYYFRPSPRNVLLVTLHAALSAASKGAVALLKTVKLHTRVKALIRFGWK